MLSLLIFGALFCLYILYLSIKLYPGDVPVYPGRIPLLGNVSIFLGDNADWWQNIEKLTKYAYNNNDVIVVYMGMIPIYYITDPDDCNIVMSTCIHKPGIIRKILKNFLGNGLLFGPVSIWKEHRKILNPTFNNKMLYESLDIFNSQSRRLVDDWKHQIGNGEFDQLTSLEKNALETICMTSAGVDITEQNEDNERCLAAFSNVIDSLMERIKNPFYYFDCIYNISKIKKTEDANVSIVHGLTDRILKKKRGERKINTVMENNNSDNKFKPFLQRLLDLEGARLGDKDIRDEMHNIIVTGFESSSSVVATTLSLLGTYPDIQEKCQQELDKVFGDSERDVNKEDLAKLKYIDAVLKEAIRYCPAVPLVVRIIPEDIQLKYTTLRKDHMCIISLSGALNNPKIWGEDVNKFIPERWLDPNCLSKNPNAFGAFGYGKRDCIAKTFALMTMKVSLVHILRNYQVTGNYSNVKLKSSGVNKPVSGHEITLELRKYSHL